MKSLKLKSLSPAIEWIERRTKLQRILIYVSTIVILVGAFVYFAYLPKHKQIGMLDRTYKDLSAKLQKAKRNAAQLNSYRTQMKAAEAQFKIVMRALPEKEEIPALLDGISMAARDAGLDIIQFQPRTEAAKEFYAEVPLAIHVEGNYHSVAVFFDKISNLPRIVNVNAVKLIPLKGVTKLNAVIEAVTYKFVEPQATPKKTTRRRK
jgi:type IV pilus assembly protein PilO